VVDDPFLAVQVRNIGRVAVYLKLVELVWETDCGTFRSRFEVPVLRRFPGGYQELERSGRTCPESPLQPGEECFFVLFDLLPLERKELCLVSCWKMWITIYSPAREIARIHGKKIHPVLVQLAKIWLPRA
jgi:hypothetical protein